jgi:hypothetical protein
MEMVFPFLTGTLAVCYGILGRRPACFALWLLTLGLSAVLAGGHFDGHHLPLTL